MSFGSEPPENRFLLLRLEPSPAEGVPSSQPQPKLKARVKSLAPEPEIKSKSFSDVPKTERIMERIRGCFARGQHPTTPEAEARTALTMAARLMRQYNVSYAEAHAKRASDEEVKKPVADESVVEVVHIQGKGVRKQAFTSNLVLAMEIFFDCKCYHQTTDNSHEYTFYGIAHNTSAAAMAFEMCFNLIAHWELAQKGTSARHSYCVGVAAGLKSLALEEEAARKKEHGMQVIVVDGERIAKEYLAAQNIKLTKAPAATNPKDQEAFAKGKNDGRKINVRGKRLEEK